MRVQDEFMAHKCYTCIHMLHRCFTPGDGEIKPYGNLQVRFKNYRSGKLEDVIACTGYSPKKEK
jgi:hypothetical protein